MRKPYELQGNWMDLVQKIAGMSEPHLSLALRLRREADNGRLNHHPATKMAA